MSRIASTIEGRTTPVEVHDELASSGRSALGRSLQNLADSGRGIDVQLGNGTSAPISNAQVRELARASGGRDVMLAGMLGRHGIRDTVGVARRVLGGVDDLARTSLRHRASGDSDNLFVGVNGRETRVVVPTAAPAPSLTRPVSSRAPVASHSGITPASLHRVTSELMEAWDALEHAQRQPGSHASVSLQVAGQAYPLTQDQLGHAVQWLVATDTTDRAHLGADAVGYLAPLVGGDANARSVLAGRAQTIVTEAH